MYERRNTNKIGKGKIKTESIGGMKQMKGYKAFYKGMICKGEGYEKQYEENTTYEENGDVVCAPGVMHFCEYPFDVLRYYPVVDDDGNIAEFAEVEALGEVFKRNKGDDKSATNKLHIGAKLGLKGFIKACIDFTFEKTKADCKDSGDSAKLASSGDYAKLASSGDYAQLASSGDYAQLSSSGDSAKLASSGDSAQLASSGKDSVVCAAGNNSIAKAMIGSWITLSEWKYDEDKGRYVPVCVKTEQVDGERIKEDTFYKLENGEFVEVK